MINNRKQVNLPAHNDALVASIQTLLVSIIGGKAMGFRLFSGLLCSLLLLAGSLNAHAQTVVPQSCGSNFVQTFGTSGATPQESNSLPAGVTITYAGYAPMDGSMNDGQYTLTPNPDRIDDFAGPGNNWVDGGDHTGNTNGRMLAVNAAPVTGTFYNQTFNNLLPGDEYTYTVYIANLRKAELGSGDLPNVTLQIFDGFVNIGASGTLLDSVNTGFIPQTPRAGGPVWIRYDLSFTALSSNLTLRLINNQLIGAQGNDLAIDDVTIGLNCADFTVVKASNDSDGVVNPGQTIEYTVTIDGLGPGTLRDVYVLDTLPIGVTYVPESTVATGRNSSGVLVTKDNVPGGVNADLFDGDLAANINSLVVAVSDDFEVPVGEALTVTYQATVDAGVTGLLTNTATGDSFTDNTPAQMVSLTLLSEIPTADLEVEKTLTDTSPYLVGDTVTYSIDVTNNGPDSATNVQVADTPSNLTITNVSGAGCTAFPCNIGSLANGATATITVTATINAPSGGSGMFRNTASVSADEDDPDPSNNTDSVSATVLGDDLTINKTSDDADGDVFPGQTVTYSVVVSNPTGRTQTGITLDDVLPSGVTYEAASTTATGPVASADVTYADDFETNDYSGNTGSANFTGDWLEIGEQATGGFDAGDVRNVSDSGTRVLRIRDNDGPTQGAFRQVDLSSFSNASLTFDYRRSGLSAATDFVAIEASADGGSTWTPLDSFAGPATDASYQNAGPYDLTPYLAANTQIRFNGSTTLGNTETVFFDNVLITANATTTTTLDNIAGGGNDLANGTPSTLVTAADNFQLAAGESITVTYQVMVDAGTVGNDVTNTATADSEESVPASDSLTLSVTSAPTANLALTKTSAPNPAVVGDNLTYTLTVTNNGPSDASNVVVTDTLPSNVSLVSANIVSGGSGGDSCAGTTTITCTIANLANTASAVIEIVAMVDSQASMDSPDKLLEAIPEQLALSEQSQALPALVITTQYKQAGVGSGWLLSLFALFGWRPQRQKRIGNRRPLFAGKRMVRHAVMAFLLLSIIPIQGSWAQATSPNLILNGDFSSGLTGWTHSYNTASASGPLIINSGQNSPLTTAPYGASNSVGAMDSRVDNDGNLGVEPVFVRNSNLVSITNGESYAFSFDIVEVDNVADRSMQISWVLVDATTGAIVQTIPDTTIETDNGVDSVGGIPVVTTSWQQFTSTFTATVPTGDYRLAMTWDVYEDDTGAGTSTVSAIDLLIDRVFLGIVPAPAFTVSKVSDDADGEVEPGQTVEYTVTAENTGNIDLTGITVDDVLPAGVTYVASSTVATGRAGVQTTSIFADNFSGSVFSGTNNNSGSDVWASDSWVRDGGNGNTGDVSIITASPHGTYSFTSTPTIQIRDNDAGMYRLANLSTATTAVLSFDYDFHHNAMEGNEQMLVQIDPENDGSYTTLQTITASTAVFSVTTVAVPVPAAQLGSANTRIRFVTGADDTVNANGEDFWIDNVILSVVNDGTSVTSLDNISGGTNGDLDNGTPPTLVTTADNFQLRTGDSLIVTYQVTVDAAASGDLINNATVDFAEVASASDSVTLTVVPAGADLEVVKTLTDTSPYNAGDTVTYTIAVSNNGPGDATNVEVTDTPAGLTITGVSGTGVSAGCTSLPCTIPSLANTATATITVTARINAIASGPSPFSNSATVSADEDDPDTSNNTSSTSDQACAINETSNQASVTADEVDPDATDNTGVACTQINPPGNISGIVWLDADGDGVNDNGEAGIGGVTVYLCLNSVSPCNAGNALATAQTDANGNYNFSGLPPGDYQVQVDEADTQLAGLDSSPGNNSGNSGTIILPPGGTEEAEFGYVPDAGTGVVEGTVWNDVDGDGIQDPGEIGIEGVEVQLCPAADPACTSPVIATTGPDGSYIYTGVLVGEYVVTVNPSTVPAGYTNTTPTTSAPFTVEPDSVVSDVDFGFNDTATLTYNDRIWNDVNDDQSDAGESGIAGVTVELLDGDGDVVATTITDENGDFSFAGLTAGAQYTVSVTDNAGLLNAMTETTSTGGSVTFTATDSGADGVIDTVGDDGTSTFGYNQPGSIGGTIYNDGNDDSTLNAGDIGLGGVPVVLLDAGGNVVATIMTNADGSYLFTGIAAGDYDIVVNPNGSNVGQVPAGYSSGNETGDPDGTATLNTAAVTLVNGQSVTDQDFGYHDASLADISGTVFNDLDSDGTHDEPLTDPEPGFEFVTVNLLDNSGNVIASTVTDASGNYSFPNVPAGGYVVAVTDTGNLLDGLDLTSGLDALPVTVGTSDVENVDFGYVGNAETAVIQSGLWIDADDDGIRDPDEAPISGVTVYLCNSPIAAGPCDPSDPEFVGEAVTDANGDVSFDGLPPGNYELDVNTTELPAGVTEIGTYGGLNPNDPISLSEGEIYKADFGYEPESDKVILSGTVWTDANSDGMEQSGELGIGGVVITITDTDGMVVTTTTTNPDGSWSVPVDAVTTTDGVTDYYVNYNPGNIPSELDGSEPTNTDDQDGDGSNDVQYSIIDPQDGEVIDHLDFGFAPTNPTTDNIGEITGIVYIDENVSNGYNAGEAGINMVTVNLYDCGPDGMCGNTDDVGVVATVETDEFGNYAFTGVPEGDYQVIVTDNNNSTVGLNPLENASGVVPVSIGMDGTASDSPNFGFVQEQSAIGNLIWLDDKSTDDGIFDPTQGDVGLAGVTVECWYDDPVNGTPGTFDIDGTDNLIRTVVTSVNGEYYCEAVPSGTYFVRVTDTAGVLSGFVAAKEPGTATPGASGPDSVNVMALAIPISLTQSGLVPVSEYWLATTASPNYTADFAVKANATLTGVVYNDTPTSGNGDYLSGTDLPVEGAVVTVTYTLGGVTQTLTTTTMSDGTYSVDVPAGVELMVMVSTTGTPVNGYAGTENAGGTTITVPSGTTGEVDFGFVLDTPTRATITTFEVDGNGVDALLRELNLRKAAAVSLLSQLGVDASGYGDADMTAINDALRFALDPDGDGVVAVVHWMTREEQGTVGYFVERSEDGSAWQRVNSDGIIPGMMNSPLGGDYLLMDIHAETGIEYDYRLVEQEVWGSTNEYGPWKFTVDAPVTEIAGQRSAKVSGAKALRSTNPNLQAAPSAVFNEWDSLHAGLLARERRGVQKAKSAKLSQFAANKAMGSKDGLEDYRSIDKAKKGGNGNGGNGSDGTAASEYNLLTHVDGLYRVSQAELLALDTGKGKKNSLSAKLADGRMALSVDGEVTPYHYDAASEAVYFAGEAYRSHETNHNVYSLIGDNGVVMPVQTGVGPTEVAPSSFTEILKFEEDGIFAPIFHSDESGDFRYWHMDDAMLGTVDRGMLLPPYVNSGNVTVSLPEVETSGNMTVRLRLRGGSERAVGNDHHAEFALVANGVAVANGESLGDVQWSGANEIVLEGSIDQSVINGAGGDISLEIQLSGQTFADYSFIMLDKVEVEYQRQSVAQDDSLWVHNAPAGVMTVSGFTSNAIKVISGAGTNAAVWREDITVEADGNGGYQASVQLDAGGDVLFSAAPASAQVEEDVVSDLRGSGRGADYLIIAPDELAEGAQAFSDYRNDTFVTQVVRLQDIYDEFSAGRDSSQAIEDFLDHVYSNWSTVPDYVVLLGRGTLDHKDELGLGESLMPIRMAATPWGLAMSDNRYADVDGDRVPDFKLGRINATNNQEIHDYLAKMLGYESQYAWTSDVVFLADNPDRAGDFHSNSDVLATNAEIYGFTPQKLYHPNTPPVRDELLSGLAAGQYVYFNYDGHGTKSTLGGEGYLDVGDISNLNNGSQLPIFAAMTCSAGNSTTPGTPASAAEPASSYLSLADTMVLDVDGGAIASFAPAGLSVDRFAHKMNVVFMEALLNGGQTIGEAAQAAHVPIIDGLEIADYMRDIYMIQGDPAIFVAPQP